MIQRVQSLFLLGVVICLTVFLFLPIWTKAAGSEMMQLEAFGLLSPEGKVSTPYLGIGIAAIVSIIIALVEIAQFKNRLNQMKLGALNSLVMALTLGSTVYLIISADSLVEGPKGNFEIEFKGKLKRNIKGQTKEIQKGK